MYYSLDPADQFVERLKAAKISASLDPAKVNAPGVWVQIVEFQPDTLSTYKTVLRLQLIARDNEPRQAMRSLIRLTTKVGGVIKVRAARARTVPMPDGTALPGLEISHVLRAPYIVPEGDTES